MFFKKSKKIKILISYYLMGNNQLKYGIIYKKFIMQDGDDEQIIMVFSFQRQKSCKIPFLCVQFVLIECWIWLHLISSFCVLAIYSCSCKIKRFKINFLLLKPFWVFVMIQKTGNNQSKNKLVNVLNTKMQS